MRVFITSVMLALGIAACGSSGGGSQPAGGASAAPQATNAPQPANATSTPSPRKTDMADDPYGSGY
jgi:hypothetical protein